jgi:hypothetical protein
MIPYLLINTRINKSRTMNWAKYVTTTGKRKRAHRVLVENLREGKNLKTPRVNR